jgi:hypothetical protein
MKNEKCTHHGKNSGEWFRVCETFFIRRRKRTTLVQIELGPYFVQDRIFFIPLVELNFTRLRGIEM